jgi:predicted nucleic acid-binding protein
MSEFVVDPALAMRWFLPHANRPYVIESRLLLDAVVNGIHRAHVPSVFFYEVAGWLSGPGAAAGLDPEAAMRIVLDLPLVEHPLEPELSAAAMLSARRHQVSFREAVYLALAERLVCPYVSANVDLVARLGETSRIVAPDAIGYL